LVSGFFLSLMNLSNIKMVVSDMDGTLLNSKHEVSPLFLELHEKMHQRGIRFVAASGRQYPSMILKLTEIGEKMSFIAENGALIIENEEIIHAQELPIHTVKEVLSTLESYPEIEPVVCCANQAYTPSKNPKFIQILEEYYSSHQRISNTEEILHAPLKVALYHHISGEHHIYPVVKGYDKELQVKISGDYWVDLSHKEANKGVALQKLLDHYNIDRSEILVFGDYLNDIEMLRITPNSVAMGNAHPEIKAIASIVTESHDNFGVERVLQELLKH